MAVIQRLPKNRPVSIYSTQIAVVSFVVFTAPVRIIGAMLLNESGATVYPQFHNKTTVPVNPDAPVFVARQVNNTTVTGNTIGIPPDGVVLPTGASFGWSSTRDTYTAVGAGTGLFAVVYYIPL